MTTPTNQTILSAFQKFAEQRGGAVHTLPAAAMGTGKEPRLPYAEDQVAPPVIGQLAIASDGRGDIVMADILANGEDCSTVAPARIAAVTCMWRKLCG